MRLNDPPVMPITGEKPLERLTRSLPLFDTPGEQYVEKRGIPVAIAHDANVRFDPDWNGRPAVIVPMFDQNNTLCSVHGRYLEQTGNQNKMFTIGPGGGVLSTGTGFHTDPIIIVEGLFDALSLAVCGYSSLATVGRRALWLSEACKGRLVILAFDGNRPGESEVTFYRQYLLGANIHRLTPPGHSKDWNTALVKRSRVTVEQWLRHKLPGFKTQNTTTS
jgi:Toprim-like